MTPAPYESVTPYTVMIIDDDFSSGALTRAVMRGAGYLTVMAESAEEALAKLSDERQPLPALLIVDIQLPLMSGLELARKVREAGCIIPMIAYTAHRDLGYEKKAFEAGCNGYVEKTGDIRLLVNVARLHIEQSQEALEALRLRQKANT